MGARLASFRLELAREMGDGKSAWRKIDSLPSREWCTGVMELAITVRVRTVCFGI